MFVRNTWYVAATGDECTSAPLGRTILNEKVVLFRDSAGRASALEDRCCHRYAPLSLGDVEEKGLRCRYHGIVFDADGQCVEIPGQDRIPPGFGVKKYPIEERHGFVWIWMGEAELADPSLIVDCHWNNKEGWPTARGYIHYKANYQLIADNLLDFSHLTFVHKSTLANDELPNTKTELENFDRGIRLNRLIENCEPSPLHQAGGQFKGKVDYWNRQVWWLPSIFENWAGSVDAEGDGDCWAREGGLHIRHFSLITPETEKSSHYFWINPTQFPSGDESLIEKVQQGIDTAFAEDRWMIEAQQQVIDTTGEFKPKAVRSDAALGRVRFMIDRLLKDEAEARADIEVVEMFGGR